MADDPGLFMRFPRHDTIFKIATLTYVRYFLILNRGKESLETPQGTAEPSEAQPQTRPPPMDPLGLSWLLLHPQKSVEKRSLRE